MRVITNQMLVDAIEKAYKEETLGALYYDSCNYIYPDNVSRCAIGAVLTSEEIEDVIGRDWNGESVTILNRAIVEFEDIEIAEMLQDSHDSWAESRNNAKDRQMFLDAVEGVKEEMLR